MEENISPLARFCAGRVVGRKTGQLASHENPTASQRLLRKPLRLDCRDNVVLADGCYTVEMDVDE